MTEIDPQADAKFLRAGDILRHYGNKNEFVLVCDVKCQKNDWYVYGWNCRTRKTVRANIFVLCTVIRDGEERSWDSIIEEYRLRRKDAKPDL